MKIGYVTTELASSSGWGHYSRAFVQVMAKTETVSALIIKGAPNDSVLPDVRAVLPKTGFGPWTQWKIAWQVYKNFRGYDVIHCLVEPPGVGAAWGSMLLGVPFILTLSGTYSVIPRGTDWKSTLKRIMMKMMYRRASIVVTGSDRNIKLIQEVMPLSHWKFVPFGVTLEEFPERNYPPAERPFILTVGAVKPRKGADIVVEAMALLKSRIPDLQYKIAGSTSERQSYVEELRHLVAEKGLGDRVEILGKVSDEDILRLYHQCTALVLAAQTRDGSFEGFPGVFYEAHACGAPIISTYGFGSEYVVKNGYNGFLVQPDDITSLAEAIAKIVENPALRQKMSENGRIEAKKHTWANVAEMYRTIYTQVHSHV